MSTPTSAPTARRERSVSQSRERERTTYQSRAPPSITSPTDYPYDDSSEFGSNNSKENKSLDLPRYAKPIVPTEVCPYCNRTYGIKSIDRHVEFSKDFASLAMTLFGGLRGTEGSSNLCFNQIMGAGTGGTGGYGQPPSVLMMNSNNTSFMRNSRSRSSLHQNFFRTKRAEPEETENTSSLSQRPTSTSTLIITPVNFYSKGDKTLSTNVQVGGLGLRRLLKVWEFPLTCRLWEKRQRLEELSLEYNSDPFGKLTLRRNPVPYGIGSGVPMTPNIDDSYSDQIFRKSDNQHGNNNNNNPETISSQKESDTSGTCDTAKSRAMSNTSSADSAFSG
ncbi:unnamed protein product [Orchesella dallaii]|uniref:Uncharacterized protein n=1 Tax=Orchesella dallaii TaxID=48710 RepID=A0ABP1RRJ4_9HEXA